MRYEYPRNSSIAHNQNSMAVVARLSLQNSGTRLPHTICGEENKSLNAMSRDHFLSIAFGKGSG